MAKFIKLTNVLLNTNDIHKILILPNVYYIHIISKQLNGYIGLFSGFGLGKVASYYDVIKVCEFNDSTDYKMVSEWINKN